MEKGLRGFFLSPPRRRLFDFHARTTKQDRSVNDFDVLRPGLKGLHRYREHLPGTELRENGRYVQVPDTCFLCRTNYRCEINLSP